MAADAFNSLGGYTVGIPAVNVVDSNGNVVTNVLALTGNVATRNLYANNYFWSNGVPFTGSGEPMGPFTSVQFNDSGLFNGSANFTYDNGNNILSVIRANVSYLTAYESVITANLGVSDLATLANIYVTNTANIELLNVSNIANVTNLYISNTANLGAVSNVTITGGNSGYLLTTDGHGVLQWSPPGTGSAISNGASNVDIGTYSGNITASVNGNTNVVIITANGLIVNGNVSATTFTGNLSGSAATVTANAQPNITSVGTLTSLVVTGNITSGNANLGNLATANYFTGILTTNAQPNITSVGTLTSLDVSGNISGGNITTIGQVVATGNITGNYFIGNGSQLTGIDATSIQNGNSNVKVYANANISTSVAGVANVLVVTGVGANVDGTLGVTGNLSASNLVITGTGLFDGNVSMNTHSITNLAEPINDADAATKYYVDSTAQGLDPKASVVAATTGNITLFGPQLIDGISIVATNRVLVKNQSQPADNGLYLCTDAAWTRTADMNNWAEVPSSYVFVETGTLDGGTGWVCTSPPGGTLGVTPITWVQFSGSGTYTAGAGLTLTGTEFSVNAAQPTITSVGTLTSLEVTGNVSAGNVSATTFTGNLTGNASGSAATVTTNAQPNITSTGTLTSLDVTGNVSAGNISATTFTGNISATYVSGTLTTNAQPNITSTGTLTSLDVTGNVSAGNISATYVSGTLTTNAQPNVTSVGTLTSLDVTGNVSAGNVSGTLLTGTLTTNAQPNVTSVGTLTSLDVTGNVSAGNVSGTLLTGTLTTNAQPNITSTGTLTSLAVTGNVSAGNVSGTLLTGTLTTNAQPNITSTGTLTSLAVTGNVSAGNISATYVSGTLTTNAQPNVTSVGTLTSLAVTGNANVGNIGANNVVFTGTGYFGANLNMNNNWINNVGYPNLTTDAATKAYVDTMISSGISYHQPVNVATTTTLTIATGGTTAYIQPNGAGNGIGAYISTTGAFNYIDTANVQTIGTRILVKNEANAAWNGVYTYANTTAIIRSIDADQYGPDSAEELSINDFFFTQGGVVNEGFSFVVSAPAGVITFGTSNITFSVFTTSQIYNAGTGLTLDGTTFSISNTVVTSGSYGNGDSVGTFTVNEQGQLTAASNVIITANAANLTGTTLAATIVNSSLTSTGTLTSLDVTGNVSAGNISATYVSGTLTTNAQPNVTSVGTLTSLDVTGNITTIGNISGDYFIGNGSQLTGVAASNAVSAGTVTTNAQPNITSVGNLTGLTVSNSTGTVDFANTANVTLGDISNLHIAGGTSGYVLSTDGNGNLTWTNSSVVGNAVPIGLPTDGDLTTNVAYSGWSTSTVVTDGLDDLNQVSLNIAGNTFVGNVYITSNVTSGPSPLSVAFTGHYIGNPTNHLWQFGDGTANSTLANPTHTYSNVAGGQFTVTYTAYNTNGTYGGNALNGAKGSVATSTNANYILLYTPMPIPTFTTSPTTLDTGSIVTITNTSLYATSYTINYGDGNSAVNPGNTWTTNSHTYNNSANVDTICGINLTGINQSAGGSPPYSVTSANTNVKIYTQQSPAITANILTTINYFATSGGQVQFRNDTPGSPGNTASFGAQQLYNFNWGDGTANSNVNIGSGIGGNPGAANLTHTFTLTTVQQNAATTVNYTANMWLYTGYSTSPFKTANVTISIEPEIRANFVGTSNTQTDATGYASNAQVGYLYTDYNGYDRSLFNFINDTSPNISFTGNSFTWTWGDTTSNAGVTSRAIISHSYLASSVGAKTVALLGTGSPGTISQSNTNTKTAYITILANPTPPSNLSSYTNVTMATASQGTSPLLAAGANDNTGGNIVANGTSVTRVASTTPVSTSTQVTNANTALTGTLTAYVNNSAQGLATFSTSGNAVGTYTSLIISADRDLHIANAAVPTGFYKVFSATISNTLASLGNGYNDFQMRHSVSGNTNTVGMVKDNLNSVPTIVTTNVVMATATAGTYRYISGIPYYSATGSPAVTVSATELQNFTGQTFRSADPYTISSGTSYEGSGSIISTQTKSLAQLDGATTMLTGSNVKANIGIGTNYVLGNLNILINGAVNGVSTLQANIFNVVGTSTTVQLPIKIQNYAGANSGLNEQAITANVAGNTQAAIRIVMSTAGNTPVFSDSTNFYTSNVWSGAQTIAGTPEAVVRYGVLKHFAVDLSTGYLPTGPNLSTGRSGLQYFTFAFVRPSLANFDIILTTGATGLSGLWVAAPGTTIDKGGFSSPTAGYPGPTSTINGWLTGFEQYNGSGVPGKSATGGNPTGTDGCAFTGADVIPLNTLINNVRYTMTLGSQNQANSTGNNILIRIALAAGQTITDLQIGVAT